MGACRVKACIGWSIGRQREPETATQGASRAGLGRASLARAEPSPSPGRAELGRPGASRTEPSRAGLGRAKA